MLKYITLKTSQINSCPKCESENIIVEENFVGQKQWEGAVRCKDCGFIVIKRTTKRAIKKWNKGC